MSPRKVGRQVSRLRCGLLFIGGLILHLVAPGASANLELYDIYSRDANNDGVLEILVISREPFTGQELVVMVGSGVQTPIVVDEYRRAITITPGPGAEQTIATHHPAYVDLDAGWQQADLDVLYGDITGNRYQDLVLLGEGGSNSYTLTWNEYRDQLVVQQVLDDERLKFYLSNDYQVLLADMNGDSMDDLVIQRDGAIVDIVLVTGRGTFFAADRTQEVSEVTAGIAANALLDAADAGNMTAVMSLMGREATEHVSATRHVLGDEAFLEELANVEFATPARIGINFSQYELAVPTGVGSFEFFPLTLERSRNGLWKIESL